MGAGTNSMQGRSRISSRLRRLARVGVLLLASTAAANSFAQTARSVVDGYDEAVKGAETIATLGPELFGESVSLQTGATSFRSVDVSIRTNSGLAVEVARELGINFRDVDRYGSELDAELLGNWKLDVPHMQGTFDRKTGWVVSSSTPQARCTAPENAYAPPHAVGAKWAYITYDPAQYWSGNKIHIPGTGTEDFLALPASRERPADGRAYYGTTLSNWRVSCLSALRRGSGQGFVAHLPDGTRYTFDWMVSRPTSDLIDTRCLTNDGCTEDINLYRDQVFIYATKVEDAHGNWVAYNYDPNNPRLLTSITSNDGVSVSLSYVSGRLDAVTTAGRTWRYLYADAARSQLAAVVLPDQSRWTFAYENLANLTKSETRAFWRDCAADAGAMSSSHPLADGHGGAVTLKHPSGASGTFRFRKLMHGTVNTPGGCYDPNPDRWKDEEVSTVSMAYQVPSLYEKTIYGAGIPSQTWSYYYEPDWSWSYGAICTDPVACNSRSTTRVTAPEGVVTEYWFGNDYASNSGLMLGSRVLLAGTELRREERTYVTDDAGQPYAGKVGIDPQWRNNWYTSERYRPLKGVLTVLDGVHFRKDFAGFDRYARAVDVTEHSSLGYWRTIRTGYLDRPALWVMGLEASKLNVISNVFLSETHFDGYGRPEVIYASRDAAAPRLAQQTLAYDGLGNIQSVTDANNFTTHLSDRKRGIPRRIQYPATPEAPSGAFLVAVVNDSGWVEAVTDENGYATGYAHDGMGRLISTVYPTGDSVAWNTRHREFRALTASDWMPPGVSPGQWRSLTWQGNYRKVTYFDSQWRPVLEHEYDESNVGGTLRSTSRQYDSAGRLAFQSYPSSALIPEAVGTWTSYDGLGRTYDVTQTSELGPLTTSTRYLPGFKTRVTNPRSLSTTTSYMAWGEPTQDYPILSEMPENKVVEIIRNPHLGLTKQLRQRSADHSVSATRSYVHDGYLRLCKTVEPEARATAMGYDNAGNVTWSAAGLELMDPNACNASEALVLGRQVSRKYDARGRVSGVYFPDSNGNQEFKYWPDGLVREITTQNDTTTVNSYHYNRRRLLEVETSAQVGWYAWAAGYRYDANGSLAVLRYPSEGEVHYAPNALGQPTQVGGTMGTFASAVSYYPNGATRQFTYGNGLVHSMTQNARQLPGRVATSGGVLDYGYYYDGNANVHHIKNWLPGDVAWTPEHKWLQYDPLDRLTGAGSGSFGGDHWHRFTYDALDNMRSWKHGGVKDYADYYYNPANNRLELIRNSAGAAVVGLGYDPQGNLQNKNGRTYHFDYGNRLRTVHEGPTYLEGYRYDGHGRRVLAWAQGKGSILSMYGQSGQMLYEHDERSAKVAEHIYLAGSLLAKRERSFSSAAHEVKYQHTDALGSPVAVTNAAAQVIERTDWEPYGAAIGKPNYQGVGYTGHVMDGVTQLTYMQQRYYDPSIGRFLSVDPIAANANTGHSFNRYAYVLNNPYKFTDPDGRCEKVTGSRICGGGAASAMFATSVRSPMDFGGQGKSSSGTRGAADSRSGAPSPVPGVKPNSVFGATRDCHPCSKVHKGTDYPVATGTKVHATADGSVARANLSSTYGNVVVIDHGEGSSGQNVFTLYAHGSKLLVGNGQNVNAGQVIMLSGDTGNSTGPHLHYEVIQSSLRPTDGAFYKGGATRFAPSALPGLLGD